MSLNCKKSLPVVRKGQQRQQEVECVHEQQKWQWSFLTLSFILKQLNVVFPLRRPCSRHQSPPNDEGPIVWVELVACTGQLVCLPLPASESILAF